MAKRVPLDIPNVRVNETSFAILRAIATIAEVHTGLRCGSVSVSHRELRSLVPVSEQTVMRSCASLRDSGLLLIREGALENGARAANEYEVTALGLEVLRLGVCGSSR
ncbi:MAG: hypothetical protein Q4B77_00820 [Coriobacteriaceae bacterium]|nr:hypothetical protein [Coriobacteriaceae bacterium]